MNTPQCRNVPAAGAPLHVLFGQPRFSGEIGWDAVTAHWPSDLAARTTVEAVEHHALTERLTGGGRQPDVVVPVVSALTAPALRCSTFGLVQQFGVGVDAIDVEAATAAGVWVANMPGLNAPHVAEHALALLLALAKRLPEAADGFAPGRWGSPGARSLRGSRAVVVGTGAVGGATARLLAAFGVDLVGVRRRPEAEPPVPGMRTYGVGELHAALRGADVVVLAATPVSGAPPLLDAAALGVLAPGALVVNVARGAVLDEAAAFAALRTGHLGGLGLDVFTREPYPADGPLRQHPRVVATAHTAALTSGYFADAARQLGEAVARHVAGRPPLHPVNSPRPVTSLG
ncbi:NAD(P)-dependent oxidoreductase [Kineococcus sp. SYSU DK003]|uniref:NAD(P)-dependent oxidoreductase n=1 Tax=Kineococcus sp. SYSU DK003 TaxID=3383124 RepID=UPI003D7C8222